MGAPQFQKQKYIYKFDVNQWKLPNLLHWIYQTFRYFGAVFDSLGIENTITVGYLDFNAKQDSPSNLLYYNIQTIPLIPKKTLIYVSIPKMT